MRSKFHNEYVQMLGDCIARYPNPIDPTTFINRYGFSRVKSFEKWCDSNGIDSGVYLPYWFSEFLSYQDYYPYELDISYSQLQKIIRTSTDPAWTSAFVRYYAKSISPKQVLLENTKDLTKTVIEVSPWWGFHNIFSKEKQEEIDEEGIYDDVIQKIRVNKNTVSITVSAIEHDDEETVVYTERASIPRNIPTVMELVRYLRDDLGSENWGQDNLRIFIELYNTYGWDFNLQPFDTYEDDWGDKEPMWKLTRRISKRKIDQLQKDANAEVRQIVQGIMNNNRKTVQPFIDYEYDLDDVLEDFEAEDWGGDPEGQLAQALARAREAPAPAPLEITELPKICRTCGDESPQAFGIFDEDDNLITESWFCNTVCADQHPIAKGQSFGAEGDYNDFISGLETYLTKFGYLDHFEAEYGDGTLSGSFSVDIENPEKFGDVEFDAESIEESDYMVITEDTEFPDADSWILYLADPEKFPRGDYDPRFAELFFVTGPGQFVDTNKYIRTAQVMGGYAPFMISQNIDETGWLKSPTTIANYLGTDSARSLSVGDIVCNPDTGICYIVANFGYHRLEPTTETFEAPLARHNLKRFQPANFKKKAGYWRKRGRDSIFGRDKNDR